MEKRFIITIRRWLWLLVLSAIVAGTTTYFSIKDQPIVYEAQTKLIIGPGIDTPDPDVNALRAGGQLMQTYAEILMTSPFLQSIIDQLDLNTTPLAMRKIVEVTTSQDTQILSFSVRHSNPERAIAITNLGADNLVELSPSSPDSSSSLLREQMRVQAEKIEAIIDQSEQNIRKLESDLQAITQVENERVVVLQTENYLEKQRLIIEQLSQERVRLSDSLSALTILYETLQKTTTNQVKIIEPAVIAIPISSYLWIKLILGAVAGLVLAGAFIFVFNYFDDTILMHEELGQISGVNTLGVISKHDSLEGTGKEGLVTAKLPNCKAAENYRFIGTKLLFASEENALRTVLFSSLGEELGGETGLVTANLALTLAESGKKIALVDGNLRNPIITEIFDLSGKPGLTDVLTHSEGGYSLSLIDQSPNLFVLPHGTQSGAAFELFPFDHMIDLIEDLKREVDIILIDTSPLLSSGHGPVLATKIDGLIMVVQAGTVHMREAKELVDGLRSIKANIVGVIFDYNRLRTSLDLSGLLIRGTGFPVQLFVDKIKSAFRSQAANQFVKTNDETKEKGLPNPELTDKGDSGAPKRTNKENLEKETFSIQITKS